MTDDVWGGASVAGPLSGVRVVDLGQYLAGPLCAMLLADQGADVVRVDPPGGPRWRSPVNAVLFRGRRHVVFDLHDDRDRRRAAALVHSADVVVENFRPGVAERLGVGPEAMCARAPHLVYCSLPGFGARDPRAGDPAWEGVVMAAAGGYSLEVATSTIPGGPGADGAPVFSPLPLASLFGALEGAMSVVAALVARERDGEGQHVEVPLFDALFESIGMRALSYERNGPAFTDFGSGFYHCADGTSLTFIASWHHHLEGFVQAAGLHAWVEEGLVDYDRLWNDPAAPGELQQRLATVFATRPAAEWEELGRAHGCTVGMLRSTSTWLSEPQATASGTFVDVEDPVLGTVRVPGPAVRSWRWPDVASAPRAEPGSDTEAIVAALDGGPPPPRVPGATGSAGGSADGATTRGPLAGLRVLDLSRVVAAPTAAKLLGQLGADVVKIDDDPAKARAAFRMPAMHEHLNRGKQTMVLDLKEPDGAALFRRLVQDSDVIVHNFTVDVEERLGIDEPTLRELRPELVYLYLNTYGRRGPWAGHRGFAELANITTGVTERSMGDERPPTAASAAMDYPRWTFTDYAAGVLGAFGALVALYDRSWTGRGHLVETSLVRATALEQVLYLFGDGPAGPDGGPVPEPRGTATPGWRALHRLYATADGTVAVGAQPDLLGAIAGALGAGPLGDDPDRTAADLERAISTWETGALCAELGRLGVGIHPVVSVGDLMTEGGIADRLGLRLEDRTEAFGRVVMPGPVARFSRTPMRPGALPGPFGCDEGHVLERLSTVERPTEGGRR